MALVRVLASLTVVVLAAVSYGVEIASAGVLDPVTESPPQLVTPPPAVEDAVAVADEAVADADEAVNGVADQATQTVADATETAGQVTERVAETAGQAKNTVRQVAGDTPAGKVLDEVERIVAPVAEEPLPKGPGIGQLPATRPAERGGATPSDAVRPSGTPVGSPGTAAGPATASPGLGVGQSVSPSSHSDPMFARGGLSPQQLWLAEAAQATGDEATAASRADDASGFPLPFSPSFPVDTAAVAAVGAGAAGGALTAALLAAIMLMAPSAGRWLRPGPTLGWPSPAVPSLERPG